MTVASRDLTTHVVAFGRALRRRGVQVTAGEATDLLRALEAIDLGDREEVRLAVRSIFATGRDSLSIIDNLFDALWGRIMPFQQSGGVPDDLSPEGALRRPPRPEPSRRKIEGLEEWAQESSSAEELPVPGASAEERLIVKDFGEVNADEVEEIRRLVARIARRLALRVSRRKRQARRSRYVDLRRTFRASLRFGGDPIELVRRRRRIRKTRLVLLCDVSGSMDLYSRFFLQFLYGFHRGFQRVESFAFSTQLTRLTPALRGVNFSRALREAARLAPQWSGGTRIGESLEAFNRMFIRAFVDRRTIVIIVSDGWDTGDVAILDRALAAIKARAARLVWLNPLLGSPDYRPLTLGMATALPHIDRFAPVHNVASLRALERHLIL